MKRAQIASETVLWIYRFVLISLIAFALVIIVGNKYSDKYDVRDIEAVFLSDKIIGCLSLESTQFSMQECLKVQNIQDYYMLLNLSSIDSNFSKNIDFGNPNLKVECDMLKTGTKFAKSPSCTNSDYLILLNNEKMKLQLELDIGKYEKNLR